MNRANLSWNIQNQLDDSDHIKGGQVLTKLVSITTAEILALFTTPKELVAAPGAGKVLEFCGAVGFLDFNSVVYDTRGIVTVKQGTTAVSDAVAAAALVQQANDCYEQIFPLAVETELTANSALNLYCDTGNPETGDSPLYIIISYIVHDFNI